MLTYAYLPSSNFILNAGLCSIGLALCFRPDSGLGRKGAQQLARPVTLVVKTQDKAKAADACSPEEAGRRHGDRAFVFVDESNTGQADTGLFRNMTVYKGY